MNPEKNIVLFGFMGTGKSAAARLLGQRLGLPVAEMDALIEKREGMAINRIFAQRGEEYFRRRERELVGELAAAGGKIIATGGGVVLDPRNVRDLESRGFLICLTARPEVILSRVAGDRQRPLLQRPDRREAVEDLLRRRRPAYDLIPRRIDTSDLTVGEVVERILGLWGERKE